MYGGKFGRGGGGRGGGRKGSSFPPPPPLHHRGGGGAATASRIPIGRGGSNPRNQRQVGPRGPAAAAAAPTEESFSLVTAGPVEFAAIIRLTPDLVEEIRRLEERGGSAKIRFDSNSNNSDGNVIDVGGKDFRFTWAKEVGHLCNIYEEQQSGENGHGMLVESGSAWRKLNVQRILDESTKNHVKMRSEEAERQLKSRKTIVLDPANPSVKNQAKTMAASEADGFLRRMAFKHKKEPVQKRRKVESSQAANSGPPKSVSKMQISSTTSAKGRPSVSPLLTPEQPATSVSPLGFGDPFRASANFDEKIDPLMSNKEDANSEKEIPNSVVHGIKGDFAGHKRSFGAELMDLRNILITLLLENPRGMSLKALEKAVGDTHPNSGKRIETIIKKIATYHAPGRYILTPGVEQESFKKPLSESGSSPESNHEQILITDMGKATAEEIEQQNALNSKMQEESHIVEKIDIEQNSPNVAENDRKVGSNCEEKQGSSSGSGSESDSESDSSDSSDSGSPSRSRSKSKSPMGSGSSSDSESDGSSSSKEGSDVDVDIMTSDDDKKEAVNHFTKISPSPNTSRGYHDREEHNAADEINDDRQASLSYLHLSRPEKFEDISDEVEVVPNLASNNNNHMKTSEGNDIKMSERNNQLIACQSNSLIVDEVMPDPLDQCKQLEGLNMSVVGSSDNDARTCTTKLTVNDKQSTGQVNPRYGSPHAASTVSKVKSRRASDPMLIPEKKGIVKKPMLTRSLKEGIGKGKDRWRYMSPEIQDQDQYKDQVDGTRFPESQGQSAALVPGKMAVNAKGKLHDLSEGHGRYVQRHGERSLSIPDESDGSVLRSLPPKDSFTVLKDKPHKGSEKSLSKNVKDGASADRLCSLSDSHYRISDEQSGMPQDAGQTLQVRAGVFPKDNYRSDMDKFPAVTGKGNILRRELSDLELGEFREPLSGEEPRGAKGFERKNSFKLADKKVNAPDNFSLDSGKERNTVKMIHESKRQSPINLIDGSDVNQDKYCRRMPDEDNVDPTIHQQRLLSSQTQQNSSVQCVDYEVASQSDNLSDVVGASIRNEVRLSKGTALDNHGSLLKKVPASISQQDLKQGGQAVIPKTGREIKPQKIEMEFDSNGRRKDRFGTESSTNGGKRRESSSDDDSSFYTMYDKDEPELKGPIKDYVQYKEYVKEYCEKYDRYSSLNKNLESYRRDFQKLGRELELAKGRDAEGYYNVLEQIKETYRQCGTRHKRMKKIFVVLHEELKHLKQRIKDFAQKYTRE